MLHPNRSRQSSILHGLQTEEVRSASKERIRGHPTLSIASPILAGLSVTMTPAFSRAATLSLAAPDHDNQHPFRRGNRPKKDSVPFPPEMMAPACPIRLPGGAVRPAMKATTGLGFFRVLLCFSKYSAASSSMLPPISPIKTMPKSRQDFDIIG